MSFPEDKLKAKLKRQLSDLLPKGRFLFQLIETMTTNGVPDVYFSYSYISKYGKGVQPDKYSNFSCWFETKTQEYTVSIDQLNWASAHARAGGIAYIVTEIDKEICLLDYDDRMSDCSTLGVYIRRFKPFTISLNNWIEEIQLDAAIAERKR
jgi:hypothetical protein